MHLIVNHMAELDHIDHTHGRRLVEIISGAAVTESGLTELRNTCLLGIVANLIDACTVEDRGTEFHTQFLTGPSEYCLVDLAEVHT